MADGTRVTDGAAWRTRRRPELLRQFESVVYGSTPGPGPAAVASNLRVDRTALGGAAIRTEVTLRLSSASPEPAIHVLLYTPASARGRVPVVVGLNFDGNQAVAKDPGIALATSWLPARTTGVVNNRATDQTRGVEASRWQVEMLMSRGYALATAYYGDLDPDFDDGFQNGVHPLFYRAGQTRPADGQWGAIGAWAWGLSRMLDYLETRRDVDARRAIVMGHSRLGKAALWAGVAGRALCDRHLEQLRMHCEIASVAAERRPAVDSAVHTTLDLWSMLFVFMLATFVGFQVIQNVSRLLHTPLMSLTNAISAIAIVGLDHHRGRREGHDQPGPGLRRRRRLDDQHRQRLPDHGPHAQDVPREGEDSRERGRAPDAGQLPGRRGAVRLLAAVAEQPQDGAAGRGGRRGRHVAGRVRHAAPSRDRQLHLDRRRAGHRHDRRRAAVVGAADRGAAADGVVACLRRPGGRPGRHGQVHAVARGRRAHLLPHVRDHRRGAARLPDAHRQPDGRRQAAGSAADAAHHLQEPERLQRAAGAGRAGLGRLHGVAPRDVAAVPGRDRAVARFRRAAGAAHRRRRHADGHLAAQLLRGAVGGGDGLRARQQAADRRRRARRVVGLHPVGDHVQGDEPLVHQRAVRRLRTGRRRLSRRPKPRRSRAPRRRTSPTSSKTPAASSSCPATGWRWRRRSTACASCTSS